MEKIASPEVQALLDALIERDIPPTAAELRLVVTLVYLIGMDDGRLEASDRMMKGRAA